MVPSPPTDDDHRAPSTSAGASPTCPFCAATAAELISLFGSQLLLSQYRCSACGSYFEGLRPDRWVERSQPDGR
jgi:hypothetical protein